MSNIQPQIDELIIKFLNGTLDDNERGTLDNWITASDANAKIFENLTNEKWVTGELGKMYSIGENAGWNTIVTALNSEVEIKSNKHFWYKWVAAAIIVVALGSGYWSYIMNNSDFNQTPLKEFAIDIQAPATNKAILTLADGTKIVLEEASNGKLVAEGDVQVTKTEGGKIIYEDSKNNGSSVVNENTLFVPRGSKPVQLVLSDGTEVWLNTGSSLTYPSRFVGIDRKVKMTGEVFFDVAKNPAMPFKVMANGIETQALGTQFNINAYSDEPMAKITLIEGSIKVERKKSNTEKDHLIVKPGQQVLGANHLKLIENANLEEVMAWKNGQFHFEGANIRTIMGQISKFYNVDVEYRDDIKYSFVMKSSRSVPVSELLKVMELTDLVRFKIEGNKIIVLANKK
ncbi:FecR family protein [Flavobacterium gillisiae]|uniref:FecR family protein n=1 Tax=Flavobacterium gillisiae TaxID=150146 RepID=A0A1H4CPH0_9FLAO|nr:FecR family protein [Flavobacterium gillisiae]SEA62305.1 FecR family protein [Flavobacterium gillisiae]